MNVVVKGILQSTEFVFTCEQEEIANRERTVLEVDLDDVASVRAIYIITVTFPARCNCCASYVDLLQVRLRSMRMCMLQYHDADTLLDGFENNSKRFVKILCEAADDAMPIPDRQDLEEDIYDILYNQVKTNYASISAA